MGRSIKMRDGFIARLSRPSVIAGGLGALLTPLLYPGRTFVRAHGPNFVGDPRRQAAHPRWIFCCGSGICSCRCNGSRWSNGAFARCIVASTGGGRALATTRIGRYDFHLGTLAQAVSAIDDYLITDLHFTLQADPVAIIGADRHTAHGYRTVSIHQVYISALRAAQ